MQGITDTLLEPRPGSLREKMNGLRAFADVPADEDSRVRTREDIAKLHEMLAEQLGSITLQPIIENGERRYVAEGK